MLTNPPAMAGHDPAHPRGLRIGDREREVAADRLGEHLRAGRLDPAEYTERAEAVWGARTAAELAPLFADLPGGAPSAEPTPEPRRPVPHPRGVAPAVLVLLVIAAAVLWVALVHVPPFFLFPLAFFVLYRRRWQYGPRRW